MDALQEALERNYRDGTLCEAVRKLAERAGDPVEQCVLNEAASRLPQPTKGAGDLEQFCRDFVAKQRISCPETIYQCDWVIENAYEFIEGVCERVGYREPDE